MGTFQVVVSKVIDASPAAIYDVLIDMEQHRKILPKEFTSFVVEEGGRGAGTVVQAELKVLGAISKLRLVISEPEPGRVMKEVDEEAGIETTWTLNPVDEGQRCQLVLETRMRMKPGLQGWIERLASSRVLPGIYQRELQLLADQVQAGVGAP